MKTTEEKSIKNSDTKIKLITFLYCEGVLKESVDCKSKKCMDGRCLCMDTEQLGLLLSIMFDEREWYPADLSESAFVRVLTQEEENKVICHQQKLFNSEVRLLKCDGGRRRYKQLEELLKKSAPQKIRTLLNMLPIIKMTNVTHQFNERYSLVYICTFGDYAANFVEHFIAMMIGYIIKQYNLGEDVVPILQKMELFFELLIDVNSGEFYEECVRDLVEQIEGYHDSMSCFGTNITLPLAGYMWDFRKVIKEYRENHQETSDIVTLLYSDDEVEFVHLCHLMKTILDIIKVDYIFEIGNLQFYMDKKSECSHDIFDKLESMLINEKNSGDDRKRYVLGELKKLFDEYGNWADEDLIQLGQNISN